MLISGCSSRQPASHGGGSVPSCQDSLYPSPRRKAGMTVNKLALVVDLAFFLEDLGPVDDELVQGLLGRALIGDDIVMETLLHRLEQRGIGRLLPEVLDILHRFEELRGKGLRILEGRIVQHGIEAGIAAK